jgi:hypothetical protein
MDAAGALGMKINAYASRLEGMAARLLAQQKEVQQKALALSGSLNVPYQQSRLALQEKETDRVTSGWHPKARVQNRGLAWSYSSLGEAVIDFEACKPELAPAAASPLEDTYPGSDWSKQREQTVRILKEQAALLLAKVPKLLEVAANVLPRQPAPEPVTSQTGQPG